MTSYSTSHRSALLASTILLSMAAGTGTAFAAQAPVKQIASSEQVASQVAYGQKLDEIVVTARHRREKLQEVPIPITAINGDALAKQGAYRIDDIQNLLPNTYVWDANPRQNSVAIRGLGNNPANDGLESSTGVYLDGVYLGRPGMAIFDFDDLDQFELLRGPQGTLFGKNTTAGALNITTKGPSFTPGGFIDATFGNYGDREFRGAITGPINDKIAYRFSAYDVHRDGFLKNLTGGTDYDGLGRQGARLQFLLKPTNDVSVRIIGEYDREHDPNELSTPYGLSPESFTVNTVNHLPSSTSGLFYVLNYLKTHGFPTTIIPTTDPYGRTSNANGPQSISVQQGGLSAQVDWNLPNDFQITSITAGRFWRFSPLNDADGTNFYDLEAGAQNHDGQFSQELRLASPKGRRFDYTAGLYFFYQGERVNTYTDYGSNLALNDILFGPGAGPVINGKSTSVDSFLHTLSYAAFGQADYHVTDKLTLTAGLRETDERKSMRIYRNLDGTNAPTVRNVDSATYGASDLNLAGTIAAAYKWNENLNLYSSFAHGAKAGAMNNSPPGSLPLGIFPARVYPEKADDAEIGFKTEFFDHRLRVNGNAFYELVRNYQATSTFIDSTGASLFQGSYLTNVGAVHTRGFELEATVNPLAGLTVSATASYDNASYQSFRNGPCPIEQNPLSVATKLCDLTGRPVTGSPRWQQSLTANYTRDLGHGILGYTAGEFTHRSGFYGFIDDSQYSWIKGYSVVNLKVGVKIQDSRYDISLWTRNLFNQGYYAGGPGNVSRGTYSGYLGDPRTFGVELRAAF